MKTILTLAKSDKSQETVEVIEETSTAWHGYPAGWTIAQKAQHGYRAWLKAEWEVKFINGRKVRKPKP